MCLHELLQQQLSWDNKNRPHFPSGEDCSSSRTVFLFGEHVFKFARDCKPGLVSSKYQVRDQLTKRMEIEPPDQKYFVPVLAWGRVRAPDGVHWYYEVQPQVLNFADNFDEDDQYHAMRVVEELAVKYGLGDLDHEVYACSPNWYIDKEGWPIILDFT